MQVVRPGAGRMDSHVTESRTPVHKSPGLELFFASSKLRLVKLHFLLSCRTTQTESTLYSTTQP